MHRPTEKRASLGAQRTTAVGTARSRATYGARGGLVALAAVILLTGASCTSQPASPEAQVRALIEQAERSAEAKDLRALAQLVSETYADARDYDREALVGLIRYHFTANDEIHLLGRIGALAASGTQSADATVFLAMTGHHVGTAKRLADYRADVYRLDLILALEADEHWRVVEASWRRAELDDLLDGSVGGPR